MKKYNNCKKFDLESINFIESINDQQAECILAGKFEIIAHDGNPNFEGTHTQASGNATGAIAGFSISNGAPGLRLENRNPSGSEGNIFRATYFDNDLNVVKTFRRNSGRSISLQQNSSAIASGATRLFIEQIR